VQLPKPSRINDQLAFLTTLIDGEDVLLRNLSTNECWIFILAPHPTGEFFRNSSISCPRKATFMPALRASPYWN
jgi:hypothetical protein